ncbi:uncharacterized protein LOC128767455 [Synchiropus splendidus]|uniref:uncharacterized protein LOC128767455 n=1 Tax=Synchiropus splendidus TaxID=270530 RepID=UPI00237E21AE|nr:uncharacterized protein LOC128767455 [Synchiropus splendidus]
MWCFQKIGFEAAIVAELQRQQQCSQFCDVLLQAEGIVVPAHSLVLSSLLTSLSHQLPPPTGQSSVLQLRTLNASTLLQIVRLLYTGKMTGEGEKEKQEAISAAVNMGIDGLVEVPWEGDERGCQRTDVGVQTESGVPVEEEGINMCRNEQDGCDSSMGKEAWTQTEEAQGHADLPLLSMSLTQRDDLLLPALLPNFPLPYTQDGVQNHLTPTVAYNSAMDTMGCTHSSYDSTFHALLCEDTPPCAGAQTCIPSTATCSEWEAEQLKHFQDNIPGFISSFLSPKMVEKERRGRRRRRRPGTGRGSGWTPKAGRTHGYLTQIVDVQNVGVSRKHLKFQQRWGLSVSSRGLGGGTAGRKMHLTTREQLNLAKTCQRRRVFRKVWEFDCDGQIRLVNENNRRGQRAHTLQPFHKSHVPSEASLSTHVMPTDRSSLHAAPPAHTLPADALHHTTALPLPEVDPDTLLDRVMLSLDITPNISRPNPQDSALRLSATESNPSGEYLNASSAIAAAVSEAGRSERDNGHTLYLQQGRELADILENILQTYEQHCQSSTPGEDPPRSTAQTTNDTTEHKELLSHDGTSAVTRLRSRDESLRDREATRAEKSSEAAVSASNMTVLQKLSREETGKYFKGKYFNIQQDQKLMKIPVVRIMKSDSLIADRKCLQNREFTEENLLTRKTRRRTSHHRRRQPRKRPQPEAQAQTNPKRRPLWPGRGRRRKETRPSEVDTVSVEESQQWLTSYVVKTEAMPGRKIYPVRCELKEAQMRARLSFLKAAKQLQNKPVEEKPCDLLCSPAGILQRKMRAKRRAEAKLSDGFAVKKICWESFTCEPAEETAPPTGAEAAASDCKDRVPFVELKPVDLLANSDLLSEAAEGDIDVVGGACPSPEIVVIDWDESSGSEGEHETIDVIGL